MVDIPRQRNAEDGEAEIDLLAELQTATWLDAQEFPRLRYVLPGILPEGLAIIVGPPKIGKSWFTEYLALRAASGGTMLGLDVAARPVLLLALEDGNRRLQDRFRKLLDDGEPFPDGLEFLTRVRPTRILDTMRAWLKRHQDGPPPLVILDTLGRAMPPAMPGESAYGRDYRVGAALKDVADDTPGSTVLLVHHDRKASSEDFVDAASGTHGLAGSVDTFLLLNRPRTEPAGVLSVSGREVREAEYAVRLATGGRWLLNGADLAEAARNAQQQRTVANLGDRSTEIMTAAAGMPGEFHAGDLAKLVDGMTVDNIARYLRRFVNSGRLVRTGRGMFRCLTADENVTHLDFGGGADED